MAKSKSLDQLDEFDVMALLESGQIVSELEYQRALMTDRLLRLLSEDKPALITLQDALRGLIVQYADSHWSANKPVDDETIAESDAAEQLAFHELEFKINRRKRIISSLKAHHLQAEDLALLLDHSETHMWDLLDGIRGFTMEDLMVLHKTLNIPTHDLYFQQPTPALK